MEWIQNIYDFKYDQIDLSDPKGVVALFERKNVELMGSASKFDPEDDHRICCL